MDNRLKQRLVGAFVIVVLAVIFIPYLVEKPTEPEKPVVSTEPPPRPSQNFNNREMTFSLSPSPSTPLETPREEIAKQPSFSQPDLPKIELMGLKPNQSVTPVDTIESEQSIQGKVEPTDSVQVETARARMEAARQEAIREQAEAARAEVAREEAASRTEAARERAEAARAEAVRAQTKAKTTPAKPAEIVLPKIELIGKPNGSDAPASPPPKPLQTAAADRYGWLVQAGSFSRSENAYELRDRLHSRGFNAFVERAKEGGNALYRVRIGPQLSRTESENVLARLQRETGINGLVLAPD